MEVGIAPPPPGVTPNFNPPYTDVQVSLIVSTAIFLFLSTGTLALRLYTSISIARKCELDDGWSSPCLNSSPNNRAI